MFGLIYLSFSCVSIVFFKCEKPSLYKLYCERLGAVTKDLFLKGDILLKEDVILKEALLYKRNFAL